MAGLGNSPLLPPSPATVASIEQVLAWRLDVAHLPPTGTAWMTSTGGSTTKYPSGERVKLPLVSGHRQTGITACPGNYLWARLDQIRQAGYGPGRPTSFRPN